jgi:hypothetical protein
VLIFCLLMSQMQMCRQDASVLFYFMQYISKSLISTTYIIKINIKNDDNGNKIFTEIKLYIKFEKTHIKI